MFWENAQQPRHRGDGRHSATRARKLFGAPVPADAEYDHTDELRYGLGTRRPIEWCVVWCVGTRGREEIAAPPVTQGARAAWREPRGRARARTGRPRPPLASSPRCDPPPGREGARCVLA